MAVSTAPNEVIHLDLSVRPDVAAHMRRQVALGRYGSESEYVESILLSDVLFEPLEEALEAVLSDEFLLREVIPALDEVDADPSCARSSEDIRLAIKEEAALLRKRA